MVVCGVTGFFLTVAVCWPEVLGLLQGTHTIIVVRRVELAGPPAAQRHVAPPFAAQLHLPTPEWAPEAPPRRRGSPGRLAPRGNMALSPPTLRGDRHPIAVLPLPKPRRMAA